MPGAGASARLAVQDGVELHPTFGWPHARVAYLVAGGEGALLRSVEGAEDDAAAGRAAAEALHLGPADVLVAVAASGTTRYTRAAQRRRGRRGALTVALANNRARRCWPRRSTRCCCSPAPSSRRVNADDGGDGAEDRAQPVLHPADDGAGAVYRG
ncbi:MAG: hypothetical protein WDN49_09745 [Acetobacteraceae bacterium]